MFNIKYKGYVSPLMNFLTECEQYHTGSIYNSNYRYIKEIIWDSKLEEEIGGSRASYEKYKKNKNISYSGVTYLRTIVDNSNKAIAYITETKRTTNEDNIKLYEILERATKELYKILKVKDINNFEYFLENENILYASSVVANIKALENIIIRYNSEPEFKAYLDKVKN